jgi:hypothetical protein
LQSAYTKIRSDPEKQKARSGFPERAFQCMAPLTGIAFASNWLINKLNLNSFSVKTTRMTTNGQMS